MVLHIGAFLTEFFLSDFVDFFLCEFKTLKGFFFLSCLFFHCTCSSYELTKQRTEAFSCSLNKKKKSLWKYDSLVVLQITSKLFSFQNIMKVQFNSYII